MKSNQDLNFLDMTQASTIGQIPDSTEYLSNHHTDDSSASISVPHSPSDNVHSASVGAQTPIHAETAYGYLRDFIDPLIIIQQCLEDKLPLVRCRLSLTERQAIRSGSIFAFIESHTENKTSNMIAASVKKNKDSQVIKRWTDGLAWSKSRVHGNFLVYKEVKEKGCMSKKTMDDALLKPDGLLKKTFAVVVDDNTWHVINYYYEDDVLKGLLSCPSVNFPNVKVDDKLLDQSKFKLKSSGPTRISPSFVAVRGRRKRAKKSERLEEGENDFGISGHENDFVNSLADSESNEYVNKNQGNITLRKVHPDSSDSDMATVEIPSLFCDLEKLAIETFHISEMFKFIFVGPNGKLTPHNFPLLMDGNHLDVHVSSIDESVDDDSALTLVHDH